MALDDVEAALTDWPNAEVQDLAECKASITSQIDTMLNLINGMLHERTRGIGVLRAVGMKRSQLPRTVRIESLLIAILGAAVGAGLAVAGACGIVSALDNEGITRFTVPVTRWSPSMPGVAAPAAPPARRPA